MKSKTPEEVAIERIEEAFQKESSELDLSNMSLRKLPKSIGKLTNLQVLNIGFNPINTVPDEVCELGNLTEFYASNTSISRLPQNIVRLTHLELLDLGGNQFSSFPDGFEDWKVLRVLSFGQTLDNTKKFITQSIGNKLDIIPPTINALENLEILDLSGNQIKQIPPQIKYLRKLVELNLAETEIGSLPIELGELASLEKLYLHAWWKVVGQITQLPQEMRKLTKLRILDLQGHNLPIPPEILKITNEPRTILNYYFKIVPKSIGTAEAGVVVAKPLNQIKLLILGQGSVGKTSIVQQILHGTFDQNQTKTEGISIN